MLRYIDSVGHYTGGANISRKWTIQDAVSVVSTGGRRNAPYLTGLGASRTLTQTANWFLGAAIQNPNNSGLLVVYNNGNRLGQLTSNFDATLSVNCFGNTIWVSTLAVTDPSVWHYYECSFEFSGAGSATLTMSGTVWVDGLQWGTYSGTGPILVNQTINGAATANQVGWTGNSINVMDFYAVDNAGTDINGVVTTLTSFLGDVEIDALFPAADITTSWGTFGGSGTGAYTCVSETSPDDDTSYVDTTSTGSSEAFTYQPISGFTGSILGVQYLVCAKKSAEGSRTVALTLGTSTVKTSNFLNGTNFLSDYYVYFISPLDTDNGTAWTTGIFNTSTFGVTLVG